MRQLASPRTAMFTSRQHFLTTRQQSFTATDLARRGRPSCTELHRRAAPPSCTAELHRRAATPSCNAELQCRAAPSCTVELHRAAPSSCNAELHRAAPSCTELHRRAAPSCTAELHRRAAPPSCTAEMYRRAVPSCTAELHRRAAPPSCVVPAAEMRAAHSSGDDCLTLDDLRSTLLSTCRITLSECSSGSGGSRAEPSRVRNPGYMSRKFESFERINLIRKQTEILSHATHVNGWFSAVYVSCMSPNFHLFRLSNLSVRNFRIFLLMYPGSVRRDGAARGDGGGEGWVVVSLSPRRRAAPLCSGAPVGRRPKAPTDGIYCLGADTARHSAGESRLYCPASPPLLPRLLVESP